MIKKTSFITQMILSLILWNCQTCFVIHATRMIEWKTFHTSSAIPIANQCEISHKEKNFTSKYSKMVEKSKFENNAVDVAKIIFFPKTKQLRFTWKSALEYKKSTIQFFYAIFSHIGIYIDTWIASVSLRYLIVVLTLLSFANYTWGKYYQIMD